MESLTILMVLVEIVCSISSSSGSSFDAHPDIGDNWSPRYDPSPAFPPGDWMPDSDFAYTEVLTPFYHYYFYAPAFKKSFLKDPAEEPNFEGSYVPSYKTWKDPQYNLHMPQSGIQFIPQNSRNDYYSPQFNDVKYPSLEISTHNPKFHRDQFLEKPYSTAFSTRERYNPPQKSSFQTPLFLPTALSSGTSNIIRKESQGRAIHGNIVRPYSYAPTFKEHEPHNNFRPDSPSYKQSLSPSLFSSTAPNIIRDEVSPISKLFRVSSNDPSNNFASVNPSLRTPSYSFTFQNTIGSGDYYNPSTSISPIPTSTNPPFSFPSISTNPPFSFPSSAPPEYPVEETLSPVFTSSPNPLEDIASAKSPTLYTGPRTTSTEVPRHIFEAPGHTEPRRR